VLRGPHTLSFNVFSDGFQPIRNIKLQVLADNDSGAEDDPQPLLNNAYNCNNQPSSRNAFLVPWDTATDTPHNGHYKIVVTVDTFANPTCGGTGRSTVATRTGLIVDNYPDQLDPPKIIATTQNTISIAWDASTAPDVTRYTVYRALTSSTKAEPSDGQFKFLGYSTSPSYRDDQASVPAAYWYAVVVTRRSVVTPETGISSPMSDPSQPVYVAPPPPSTTGGGSGGNILSGSASGSSIRRFIPLNPLVLPPSRNGALAPVPDAPYSAQLPYGNAPEAGGVGSTSSDSKDSEPGATDPRGPVLPVAVGAFLVSAALALGRMPY
jgi:hypothetical protein